MKQASRSEITAIIEKLKQKPQLNRHERRHLVKLENKLNPPKVLSNIPQKNIFVKLFIGFIILLVFVGLFRYIKSLPNLPPIDLSGHIEQNPPSHISDQEMPELVQKHMLEHADGEDKKGQIVNFITSK